MAENTNLKAGSNAYERPSVEIIAIDPMSPLMGSTETFNSRKDYDSEWA